MVESGPTADIKPGQRAPAREHPDRHDGAQRRAEAGQGAKMARSAGASVQLVAKDDGYGVLRLPSARCAACR
jgi:large subunit ribosomal protein L2